jgi:hypothetical protein
MPTDEDIRAFEQRRKALEQDCLGKFVVFHGGQLVGAFDDFDSAGKAALQFGESPSLIRKVGEALPRYNSISVIRS